MCLIGPLSFVRSSHIHQRRLYSLCGHLANYIGQITEDGNGRISFVFDGGEGDGINGIAADKASSSALYNLQGVRTGNTNVSGVYVKNGRKIMVR